jgi:hypothetical protein
MCRGIDACHIEGKTCKLHCFTRWAASKLKCFLWQIVNMPIPAFDHNGVLPPHLGLPTEPLHLSPYPATVAEVCQRFCFSLERQTILQGWLDLRRGLRTLGYNQGFQWLDGSFVEDIENGERNRPPGDIDVVSFLFPSHLSVGQMEAGLLSVLSNRSATKIQFHVDHFIISLNAPGISIVEQTRYWCGLFSHRRLDSVWKGMLKVELGSQAEDDAAQPHIENVVNA